MNGVSMRVQRLGRVRPNVIAVAGVGFLGLAAGLALVNASMAPIHPERGRVAEPTPEAVVLEPTPEAVEAEPTPAPAPEAVVVEPTAEAVEAEPTAAPEAVVVEPTAEAVEAEPTAAPSPAPPAAVAAVAPRVVDSDLRMTRGRLAYIRCASGSNPCPRDRALEASVWRLLGRLPSCAGLHAGASDVRLLMSPGAPPELSFRAYPGAPVELDSGLVRACVEPGLTTLRTTLAEARYVVSFRFLLEER